MVSLYRPLASKTPRQKLRIAEPRSEATFTHPSRDDDRQASPPKDVMVGCDNLRRQIVAAAHSWRAWVGYGVVFVTRHHTPNLKLASSRGRL